MKYINHTTYISNILSIRYITVYRCESFFIDDIIDFSFFVWVGPHSLIYLQIIKVVGI